MSDSASNSLPIPVRAAAPGHLEIAGTAIPLGSARPISPPNAEGVVPQGDLRALLTGWRRIIAQRWVVVLGISLALLSLGLVRTLLQMPHYTATVRIQIDRQAAKIVDGGSVSPAEVGDNESFRTQYEVLRSRSMAERVASSLKAGDDLDLLAPRGFSLTAAVRSLSSSAGEPDPAAADARTREQLAVDIVAGNVVVRPVPGSRLVDIAFTDPSPARAARIANAFAEAYISQNIDKRFQANAYARTFLDDQSQQLSIRLQASETALLQFSEEKQIIILSERSTIAEANLAAASAALSNLVSERIRNEQIWRQVEAHEGVELPQFLTIAAIQHLRGTRKALETEYQEKLQTFRPSYPAMIELSSKIREIDRQLATEVRTIRASLKGAWEVSLRQEQETRAQIDVLRTEVLDLQRNLIRYNILKREAETNRSLYNGLLQRLKEVEVAGGVGTNNVFVVDRARVPASPTSPNLLRALLLWTALGLALGVGAAYALDRLDDTVRTPEELERITELPILGTVPRVARAAPELELHDPRSALAEAYRSFCTSLQFAADRGLPRTLLITSAGPAEGKSVTSIAVARHFALRGLRVLLIDADLRNPSLHEKLGLADKTGLSSCLSGDAAPPEAMQATDIANLAFMPAGPLPANAADLLASPRLVALLATAGVVFDLVVVDGPPVMGLADAQLLSSATRATVFVVGAGQVRAAAVRRALRRMALARAPLIGAVITEFDAGLAGYGCNDYGYGYGAGRADEAASRAGTSGGTNAGGPARLPLPGAAN